LVCLHIILPSENAVKTRLGRARINVPVISC
jgi:IMP dehydrogenase/GMP reductase